MWCGRGGHAVGQGEGGFWHICFQSVASPAHPLWEGGHLEGRSSGGKAQREKQTKVLPFLADTAFLPRFLKTFSLVCTGRGRELKLARLSCTVTAPKRHPLLSSAPWGGSWEAVVREVYVLVNAGTVFMDRDEAGGAPALGSFRLSMPRDAVCRLALGQRRKTIRVTSGAFSSYFSRIPFPSLSACPP